jgi:hypothetical protein
MITDLKLRHLEALEKLPHDFILPDLSSKLVIAQRAIEVNGELQAVGLLKLTSEAMLLVDEKLPLQTRTIAIKQLLMQLVFDGERLGLDDCHVFVRRDNGKMKKFLEKFKFIEVEFDTMYLPPRSQNGEASNKVGA